MGGWEAQGRGCLERRLAGFPRTHASTNPGRQRFVKRSVQLQRVCPGLTQRETVHLQVVLKSPAHVNRHAWGAFPHAFFREPSAPKVQNTLTLLGLQPVGARACVRGFSGDPGLPEASTLPGALELRGGLTPITRLFCKTGVPPLSPRITAGKGLVSGVRLVEEPPPLSPSLGGPHPAISGLAPSLPALET